MEGRTPKACLVLPRWRSSTFALTSLSLKVLKAPVTMSSTQPHAQPPRTRWIIGPAQDLLLFIATPVLILPAIMGLGWAGVASVAINKWVMALGGMGHHLPGMMRAYGDRALFRRFKTRFVIAPLLLVVACVAFSMAGLHALLLASAFIIYARVLSLHTHTPPCVC